MALKKGSVSKKNGYVAKFVSLSDNLLI